MLFLLLEPEPGNMEIKWQCVEFNALSLSQLYDVLALRQEVFVVEQDCPYLDADGKDQEGWHVCGYDDEGELVAYTRILPQGISYKKYPSIGRVITSQKIRGKKKGRELMEYSIAETQKLWGRIPIKISAQSHLQGYYNSVGFKIIGDEYDEDGIPHVAMLLEYE